MPSPTFPCEHAEYVGVVRGSTLVLGEWRCPFLNRECSPIGCPFAEDQKNKEDSNA